MLFLDEPTNDLDPDQTEHLLRLLENMTGVVIILITHDDRLTGLADEILEFPFQRKEEEVIAEIHTAAAQFAEIHAAAAHLCAARVGQDNSVQTAFFRGRMLKKGLFLSFYAVMALLSVLVCAFFSILSAQGTETVMPQENEIDLILPDSDYGAAALTAGAVPLKFLAALTGELSPGEKAKLLAEAQENIGRVPVNHETLMDLPEEYETYPLEYMIPEERIYINIPELYSEQYAPENGVNMSALFAAEEEAAHAEAVPADPALLRELTDLTAQENASAGITYLVVLTEEEGGLADFMESAVFRELADSDVFIKSRETVELSALITERTRMTQTAVTAAAGECILMLIFLVSYTVLLAGRKKLFLVMRDAGYGKEEILHTAGSAHKAGTARLMLLSAAIVLCSAICGGRLTDTPAAVLPCAAISELFAFLLTAADRITIKKIITGDL